MILASEEVAVSQWGNSRALRLPAALANLLGFDASDKVNLTVDVDESTGRKRLIVDKPEQIPQSIEELFRGYSGEVFQAEVQELEPVGNEAW